VTRARATALALVNWKGVFYERYLLDPNVTALEGANGAGKTTVMIAAYVVLMPDMSRLRFTNLGESGATGGDKGIWGRLGEPGSASYAALELTLPTGERLLAGVELIRKSEPSVEASPFLVTGLDPEARLQDLLLRRKDGQDEVPTAAELVDNARALGATVQRFGTTKEYFAALFEAGVSPLRLSTDEDRNKFNEMLRTSMTGGISRALTSELRSFLLREESGLGDTLSRMRGNLDACRRTRVEVSEAQRLEHEIAGVYEAGQGMFGAALLATREQAREAERAVEQAREAEQILARELAELDLGTNARKERHAALVERLILKRAALTSALENQAQLNLARSLSEQRRALEAERQVLESAVATALAVRERANATRAERLLGRDRARHDYQASAQGLADVQKGLDELHRNAHRERRAKSRLEEVRVLLGDPTFSESNAAACLELAKAESLRVDGERLRVARDVELYEVRRTEYRAAARALSLISGQSEASATYEHAQSELTRLARLAENSGKASSLRAALLETEALAARQTSARRRAESLGFTGGNVELDFLRSALASAESELRAAEDAVRVSKLQAEQADARRLVAQTELQELEVRAARRAAACTTLSGVESSTDPWTFERARELCLRLESEHDELCATDRELSRKREGLLADASELEAQGGNFPSELLRLRDELDAELLVQRFEDIEPEQAAAAEARLGPLVHALLVNDPKRAAELLVGRPRELEHVWLVGTDAKLSGHGPDPRATDIVAEHDFGLRVTRLPATPRLGLRARQERARSLRAEAEDIGGRLESLQRRCRRLTATLGEVRPILENESWLGGTPISPARDACLTSLDEAREQRRLAELELLRSSSAMLDLGPRIDGLRALLSDAFLLTGTDHARACSGLLREINEADTAELELQRVADAQRSLEATLQALRFPGASLATTEALQGEQRALEQERDRWFLISEALAEVRELAGFFDSNAGQRALESVALVPALEEQHEQARQLLAASEAQLEDAELAREQAALSWQHADGERSALSAQCARLDAEITRLGAHSASALDPRSERQILADLSADAEHCEREERELQTSLALQGERRRELARRSDAAFRSLAECEKQAAPSSEAFAELRASSTQGALALPALTMAALLEAQTSHGSADLWADARSKRELLLDRLGASRAGAELVLSLRALLGDDERSARGDAYLKAWSKVREWLGSRVPTQVADVQDPLEALERLRDHLSALERRLGRQEGDLRGASEDIARSIEVQLRRAGNQVRRLNQSLELIRFGSIRGIRVRVERVERMVQVLRALREGDAQELLFQPTLPIEDALNEVFRRYAGGRSGGHRILDYREYIELSVEILRQTGDTWELANPTRLSTGEAIGVGAALMMVVLTEWERDANLLRGKREHGSLRFLFLDEANRLSPDNLGVLFDLCQSLELQLLIAAPEVARADGNTTYRLVRTVSDDGREEVIVSGRRATMPAAPGASVPEAVGVADSAGQRSFGFES
jgi:chromosome partition protein MukB